MEDIRRIIPLIKTVISTLAHRRNISYNLLNWQPWLNLMMVQYGVGGGGGGPSFAWPCDDESVVAAATMIIQSQEMPRLFGRRRYYYDYVKMN